MARGFTSFGLALVVAGIGAYWLSRPEPIPPVVSVVRSTEVRIAPEVAVSWLSLKSTKGIESARGTSSLSCRRSN